MNISDVAKITGLTSKAIRFYEEKGLVTPPMRSENGYRTYTQQHLNELTLLRQARLLTTRSGTAPTSNGARWRRWRRSNDTLRSCNPCATSCWHWRMPALAMTAPTARLSKISPAAVIIGQGD